MTSKLKRAQGKGKGATQDRPDPNESAVTALAVASADLAHRLNTIYSDELQSFLSGLLPDDAIEDKKIHLSYSRLVSSALARDVMTIVWMNSKFVSAEALKMAGFQNPLKHQELTRHSISKLVIEGMGDVGYDKINATQIAIHRIATALEYFGLIRYKDFRPNYKVVEGTESLHRFMQCVNTKLAGELHARMRASSYEPT